MLATGRGRTDAGENESGPNGARSAKTGARFQVLEKLGDGAQWAAYRVQNRATGEIVALKALKPAANRHPRLSKTMTEVAQTWQNLENPGLVRLHGCGEEQGTFFVTTDFLSGGSLETLLARGPLEAGDALEVLRQICAPLAFLHQRGLAHGDVRPRQILFDAAGKARLSDGGLAQALGNAGLPLADFHPDAAFYLAPERSNGAAMGPSSDVYSLGATFYRMLTGRVPFEGNSPLAVIARHRGEMPSAPSQFNPRVPPGCDALALQLLDKNPETRPTMADLARALAPKTTSPTIATPAPVAVAPVAVAPATIAPVVATPDVAPRAPLSDEEKPRVTLPKRRSIDDVVDETLQKVTQQKAERDLKLARKGHRRREFWGLLGSILFLLMLLGAGAGGVWGAYTFWKNETPKEVGVPKYLGQSQQNAKITLSKAGLLMKVVREKYDPKVPAGTVLSGDPEPGRRVRARREVLVTISAGEAPIKMLDFSNLTLPQARAIILQHGMKLGPIVDQYHDVVPRSGICGQFPEAGESFRRSEPITLIISRGQQPREIDGTTGDIAEQTPIFGDTNSVDGGDFAPLPDVGETAPSPPADGETLETRSAIAKVTLPDDGGTQLVKIVISDAKGERIIYQKAHAAGKEVARKVTVTRAPSQLALVRIYVGEVLVKEERL